MSKKKKDYFDSWEYKILFFLFTWGWAIILLIVILVAVWYFGVFGAISQAQEEIPMIQHCKNHESGYVWDVELRTETICSDIDDDGEIDLWRECEEKTGAVEICREATLSDVNCRLLKYALETKNVNWCKGFAKNSDTPFWKIIPDCEPILDIKEWRDIDKWDILLEYFDKGCIK